MYINLENLDAEKRAPLAQFRQSTGLSAREVHDRLPEFFDSLQSALAALSVTANKFIAAMRPFVEHLQSLSDVEWEQMEGAAAEPRQEEEELVKEALVKAKANIARSIGL